jgi:hypothetical protein
MELMTATTYEIPRGGNRSCGSAAIAYAMRATTNEAADILRSITGKKRVSGITDMQLFAAMKTVGLALKWPCELDWSYLGDLMEAVQDSPHEFIVVVNSRHYVTLHKGRMFDNLNRSGVPFSECPYAHLPATKTWRVVRQPTVQ